MNQVEDFYGAGPVPGAVPPKPEATSAVRDNLLDTKDPYTLQMAEEVAGILRGWEIRVGDMHVPGKVGTTAYLREVHAHVMQDIYPVYGGTRQDELQVAQRRQDVTAEAAIPKGRVGLEGSAINLLGAGQVNKRLDTLADLLERENSLRGLDKPEFVERLAAYYVQYAQAAPFSVGNNAVLHATFGMVGQQAGYVVDIDRTGTQVDRAADAAIAKPEKLVELRLALAGVVQEAPGEEAALLRRATLMVLRPDIPKELEKMQESEKITQAGTSIAGRVGGVEGELYRASMRAIREGDVSPQHLNTVRTTALAWGTGELQADALRIEQGVAQFDNWRKQDQQTSRERDYAQVRPGREPEVSAGQLAR